MPCRYCDDSHSAFDPCPEGIAAYWERDRVKATVLKNRKETLAMPKPRNTCPGCFSSIYDGAAKRGWCCDCFPKRKAYEKEARSV